MKVYACSKEESLPVVQKGQWLKSLLPFFLFVGVSGVLLGVMGYRYFITHKFMPAGLVAILR